MKRPPAAALPQDLWWRNQNTCLAVAQWAVEVGELNTTDDLLHFFEKPWHYDELHAAWYVSPDGPAPEPERAT